MAPSGTKACTRCGVVKSTSEFHKEKRSLDGLRAQCKQCRSEHMKAFYASKSDEVKSRMNAYRKAHPERIRAMERRRYEKHRDKRIALAVEAVHIRRTRMFSSDHDTGITARAIRERDGGECFYCDVSLDFERKPMGKGVGHGAQIEHVVPISKGGLHVWENVVLSCRDCNYSKGSRILDDTLGTPASIS